jgi:thioredoxin
MFIRQFRLHSPCKLNVKTKCLSINSLSQRPSTVLSKQLFVGNRILNRSFHKSPLQQTFVEATSDNFVDELVKATTPVVIDLYANWCLPCKTLSPKLETLVDSFNGQIKLVKLNVDQEPEIAQQFQTESLPSVYGLIGTHAVSQLNGDQPVETIQEFLNQLLNLYQQQEKLAQKRQEQQRQQLQQQQQGIGDTPNSFNQQQQKPMGTAANGKLQTALSYFQKGDINGSKTLYEEILQNEEDTSSHGKAYSGLAMCFLAEGLIDEGLRMMGILREKYKADYEAKDVQLLNNMLELHKIVGPIRSSLQEIENDFLSPKSSGTSADSTTIGHSITKEKWIDIEIEKNAFLFLKEKGIQKKEAAVESLLLLLKKHPKEQKVKQVLVKMLQCLGENDFVKKSRNKMASLLFK